MKKEIDFTEAREICAEHQIEISDLTTSTGSFGKKLFFINQELLLRVSERAMTQEQEKFRRIAALDGVPKIVHTGVLQREAGRVYYTLLTLLPGDDFVHVYPETTRAQQEQLGVDVAVFLDRLQEMRGTDYDIGLYVPALPHFSGSWRAGHETYWARLRRESEKLPLKPENVRVFERAFQFLEANGGVLDFQRGPKLLHNDLHPRKYLAGSGAVFGGDRLGMLAVWRSRL